MARGEVEWGTMLAVATALDTLQGPMAHAVHMKFLGEHTDQQIAEKLGITPVEARNLAYAGLKTVTQMAGFI